MRNMFLKKPLAFLLILLMGFWVGILTGCAASEANTPCKNYGLFCSKTPINSWRAS
jgi:hypothetical protein